MIQINAVARLRPKLAFDPKRASIIEAAEIATAICVVLVAYLAYVLFSILGDSMKPRTDNGCRT
jgi:hypothetical protein